jgi:NAD(P)-dependent dehydrogenase (short-subunit alcohol dehydrogenase family)
MAVETVLLTGANRGIGLEFARQYSEAGKRVLATCRNPENAGRLLEVQQLHQETLQIYPLDVTEEDSVRALVNSLANQPIDVLINNAGIRGGAKQGLKDIDYRAWADTFAVNTMAPFRMTVALIPNLRLSVRPRVITLSSQMGSLQRKGSGSYIYRSSKAAVNKVMQLLAEDLHEHGIVVCPVHPGWVQTDMGGAAADLTAQESAAGLIRLIDGLTLSDSGRFFKWNGEEHPW